MLAKITPATISGVVNRDRLFHLLDGKLKRPVVWVSAPAGAGKTTLVASYLASRKIHCIWYQCDEGDADLPTFFYYMGLAAKKAAVRRIKPLPLLTPEYLAGISTFTRRYFERLFSSFTAVKVSGNHCSSPDYRFAVIFDNYQDVPGDSPFHDMFAAGCDAIPEGAGVVVISRGEPPSALARLQANGKIGMLRYRDVRFTLNESKALLLGRGPKSIAKTIGAIHRYTHGWAAGMILMLESASIGSGDGSIGDAHYDKIFDYFAGELFNRSEKKIQVFLLKTAFLPMLSIALAEKLTGAGNAGQILRALNRNNFFTERLAGSEKEYHYHPLFRDFLLNRAKAAFSDGEMAAIQQQAALLLEQEEMVEEAARLYGGSGDGQGLGRMVVRHARELLRQGRNRTVADWIAGIPPAVVDHDPWLIFWSGMYSFPFDMPRARKRLESAFAAFKIVDDVSGLYLAWAGIVDTYAYELEQWERLDDCITDFENLIGGNACFPSKEIDLIASSRMLIALTLRRTDQPQKVEQWLERVTDLLRENPSIDIEMDTAFCMSLYYLWKGEYHKNALLLDKAEAEILLRRPPPFAVIRIRLMKGIHYWVTAQYDAALQTLAEGLEVSHESGMHVFDSLMWSFRAAAEMASGKMETAEKSLKNQMAALLEQEKTLDIFFYHINAAWHALLEGKPSLAAENLQAVSAKVTEIGTPYYRALWNIGMAQTAFLQGRPKEAKNLVHRAHRISLTMQSHVMEWYSLLIEAYFLLREGKPKKGLAVLRRGLSLGRHHGYTHLEFYQPSVMQLLCAKALQAGIEQEYVKGLVRKLELTPPEDLIPASSDHYLENWPYRVKIYTLGRFEILSEDKPIQFAGKVQKKPLELLKALIAYGGMEVPEERLTDQLWPDADGDLAHKSLETTLSRLRRLLGKDEVVTCRAGQLGLNPVFCWVDCFALTHLLNQLGDSLRGYAAPLVEKAVDLYKGPFLASDIGLNWALPCRETLKNRLLRVLLAAGRRHEQAGKWEKAAGCYTKGIEIDPLAEECYRHLMNIHRILGSNADAAKTYLRCRDLLQAELGIAPSTETQSLYDDILRNR